MTMVCVVLRVYGAAAGALERVVGEDGLDICGYHLPEGTVVGTIPYCVHRLPEVFLRPDEFRPERWLRRLSEVPIPLNEQEDLTEMNAHFVPFGIGPRVCGGQSTAMAVVKMVVVAMVRNFGVEWRGKEGDMDVIDSFVSGPGVHLLASDLADGRTGYSPRWAKVRVGVRGKGVGRRRSRSHTQCTFGSEECLNLGEINHVIVPNPWTFISSTQCETAPSSSLLTPVHVPA